MGVVLPFTRPQKEYPAEARLRDCRDTLFAVHQRGYALMVDGVDLHTVDVLRMEVDVFHDAAARLSAICRSPEMNAHLATLQTAAWTLHFCAYAWHKLQGDTCARAAFASAYADFSRAAFALFPRLKSGPRI